MNKFLTTTIGRLRLIAGLEGLSLLMLVFITVPLKRIWGIPEGSQIIGPIHGVLFILYVFYAFKVGFKENWKFFKTTWKVLLASFIPFGTFYIDHTILKKIQDKTGHSLVSEEQGVS